MNIRTQPEDYLEEVEKWLQDYVYPKITEASEKGDKIALEAVYTKITPQILSKVQRGFWKGKAQI